MREVAIGKRIVDIAVEFIGRLALVCWKRSMWPTLGAATCSISAWHLWNRGSLASIIGWKRII